MATRVFGPVRGAGVQVNERSGERPIEPGALGLVGYAGVLEKGPTGELIGPLTSAAAAFRQVGSIIPDSLLPDAIDGFYGEARGAGGIMLVRVTDGNEQKAKGYKNFDRDASIENLYARRPVRTPIGRLSAKNGGRWGGKKTNYTDVVATVATDITATTLITGLTKFTTDELKGGVIQLDGLPGRSFEIIGNTAAGVVSVSPDQDMAAELAAGSDPTNDRYYLVLDNVNEIGDTKELTYEIRDGEEKPSTEFGMFIYVDGVLVLQYPDLSLDPNDKRYWVDLINQDGNNFEIEVEDLFTGARTADVRPANHYGDSATVTETILTAEILDFQISSPGGGNPTAALGTTSDIMLRQKITITMSDPTTGTAVSDRFGALGTVTLGTLFDPVTGAGGANQNKWIPPFTVTAGGNPLAAADVLTLNYVPFEPDALIDGFLYPDKPNSPLDRFRIVDNDHNTITVADGSDMTAVAVGGDEFMVEFREALCDGRDGIADLSDSDYTQQAWDVDNSPFNRVVDKGFGLIKYATPGVTATAVQKAGKAYAEAKNHQYRYEVPENVVTESAVDTYVNSTLGRSDYAVVSFPTYGDIADPNGGGEGRRKTVSMVGDIHGREARIAVDFNGYHKAQAGEDAVLSRILDIATGEALLNEELLNPRGINVIKKVKGNYILWGDRTLWLDPAWKFKHQREVMSYYEHVLQESFGFIIFGLNNAQTRETVRTSLISFFLPEYTKQALDNDFRFSDAASIKIDTENNTPATKAAGDMVVEILLRLTDTVERLRIFIGKAGIFEAVA